MFSEELRQQLLKETCSEIARNGFKKILIYNGHGGNQAMISNFSRSVLQEDVDYCVFDYSIGTDFATPKKLLQNGSDVEFLAKVTGLPETEIESIVQKEKDK